MEEMVNSTPVATEGEVAPERAPKEGKKFVKIIEINTIPVTVNKYSLIKTLQMRILRRS